MIKELTRKDRLFLAAVFVWIIVYSLATIVAVSSIASNEVASMWIWQRLYVIVITILSGLGSFALICLSLYQFRKTHNRFFYVLLAAYIIVLIKTIVIVVAGFSPVFIQVHLQLFTQIEVYGLNVASLISLVLLLYAFATYSLDGTNRHPVMTFKKTDVVILVLVTALAASFSTIPDLFASEASRPWSISVYRLLPTWGPILLLWAALWQYRRTENMFFRFYILAYSLAIAGLLVDHSTWYLTKFGLLPLPSLETMNKLAQWSLVKNGIGAVINLCVFVLEVYALATFNMGDTTLANYED